MSRYVRFRDFDWVLLIFVLIICLLGVSEIYSATLHTKFEGMHVKQVYWIVAGRGPDVPGQPDQLPGAAGTGAVDVWLQPGLAGFGADFRQEAISAQSAGSISRIFHFQPSEWVKLILILTMAKYFAEYRDNELPFRELVKAGLVVLFPMLLVLKQPDLGTALTYIPIAVMALFLGGMRPKHGMVLLLIAAVLMPAMWKWG